MEHSGRLDLSWCERIGSTDRYVVVEEQYHKGTIMPVGHEFELSVPWCLTWIQSRHGPKLRRMAAWHDLWLARGVDRTVAAAEARLIAREDGVEAWYTHVLFWAMTLWTAYD